MLVANGRAFNAEPQLRACHKTRSRNSAAKVLVSYGRNVP